MTRQRFLLLLLFFVSCTQPIKTNPTDIKEFFSQLTPLKLNLSPGTHINSRPYVIDSIEIDLSSIIKLVDAEPFFDPKDIAYFKGQLLADKAGVWQQELFDSIKIVSQTELDSIRKFGLHQDMAPSIRLSKPYFSKDKQYCIQYYNYYCGNLCSETALKLYKRINGKWTFIKNYFQLVS